MLPNFLPFLRAGRGKAIVLSSAPRSPFCSGEFTVQLKPKRLLFRPRVLRQGTSRNPLRRHHKSQLRCTMRQPRLQRHRAITLHKIESIVTHLNCMRHRTQNGRESRQSPCPATLTVFPPTGGQSKHFLEQQCFQNRGEKRNQSPPTNHAAISPS